MSKWIAIIKVGWCESYNGDEVFGGYERVSEGHERYNFRRGSDGSFYGYTPPASRSEAAPSPANKDGWLVFVLSKRLNQGGLYLVGWYNDARFLGRYEKRPEYDEKPSKIPQDLKGNYFRYTLVAPSAVLIPEGQRPKIDTTHIRSASVCYLAEPGISEPWRTELAGSLLKLKVELEEPSSTASLRGRICSDPTRREEVEAAAIGKVKEHFAEKDFICDDVQRLCCGYDLHFKHRQTGKEQHVEVKGTAMDVPHFFMSSNEYAYAEASPHWLLAIVTNALKKPRLELMNYSEAKRKFVWETLTWHAKKR